MASQNSKLVGPIPKRWLGCPRRSSGLVCNKFLAFKTPLSSIYDSQVPVEERFYPSMAFAAARALDNEIGLWIDLTNTTRFYDKGEIEAEACKYVKLACTGYGEPPSLDQTQTFIQICDEFIESRPFDIIAVHCTHGFNRTGFLIVAYIFERVGCDIRVALNEFKKVRHPGIYKHEYLKELFRRYDEVNNTPTCPPLPVWCQTLNGTNGELENERLPKRKELNKARPSFMAGVPGVFPVTDEAKIHEIQRKVQGMCKWTRAGFPGCQPVSMNKQNIKLLGEKPYKVSWKADGTRYMMLIDGENKVYFVDRNNYVFYISGLRFPHKKNFNQHLKNTLLDGEMVLDVVDDQYIPRYLAYDIVTFEGADIGITSFDSTRLRYIDQEIVIPRKNAMLQGLINRAEEPFSVRLKQFWDITQTYRLLGEKFEKNLSHSFDGLIFQPAKAPYFPGKCDEVLKWKPIHLNSVDFKLKVVTETGEGLLPTKLGHLYVGGSDYPFASIQMSKELQNLDDKIIECCFENNQWVVMRERTDKTFPNSYKTAMAVCRTIKDPLTVEALLDFIDTRRWELQYSPNKRKLPVENES